MLILFFTVVKVLVFLQLFLDKDLFSFEDGDFLAEFMRYAKRDLVSKYTIFENLPALVDVMRLG